MQTNSESEAVRSSLIAMHLTDTARGPVDRALTVTPMKEEASPGLPVPSRIKGESIQLPHHPSRATGNRQAQSNSSCRAPPPALGWDMLWGSHSSRQRDWPGAREEGWGRGGGAGSWQGPKASLPALE